MLCEARELQQRISAVAIFHRLGVARRQEGRQGPLPGLALVVLRCGPGAVVVFKSFVGAAGFRGALEDDASLLACTTVLRLAGACRRAVLPATRVLAAVAERLACLCRR